MAMGSRETERCGRSLQYHIDKAEKEVRIMGLDGGRVGMRTTERLSRSLHCVNRAETETLVTGPDGRWELGQQRGVVGRYNKYDVDKAETETLVTGPDGGGG